MGTLKTGQRIEHILTAVLVMLLGVMIGGPIIYVLEPNRVRETQGVIISAKHTEITKNIHYSYASCEFEKFLKSIPDGKRNIIWIKIESLFGECVDKDNRTENDNETKYDIWYLDHKQDWRKVTIERYEFNHWWDWNQYQLPKKIKSHASNLSLYEGTGRPYAGCHVKIYYLVGIFTGMVSGKNPVIDASMCKPQAKTD